MTARAGVVLAGDLDTFEALEIVAALRRSWAEWDSEAFQGLCDRLERAFESAHWAAAAGQIPALPDPGQETLFGGADAEQ